MNDRTRKGIGASNWENIDWKVVNTQVRKLRKRIFKATQNAFNGTGSWNKVRSLMKLLMRSFSALLMAIKKVTYLNKGRNTAGVDGFKAISNEQRNSLIRNWDWYDTKPTKRVYIPKANSKKRPLGIPTIFDRIGQAIMLYAYEPVFETTFEPSSYGFRPSRSCHDAISDIFQQLRKGSSNKWVLDADIRGAFDNILHEFIMQRIEKFPGSQRVFQWLKAGYVEEGKFFKTNTGTPQGGIISPLLCNIALDGLQSILAEFTVQTRYRTISRGKEYWKPRIINKFQFIRYADDFVILSPKQEWLEEVMPLIREWLKERGLELNEEKTAIRNIRDEGFSFLGFDIRQMKGRNLREGSNEYNRLVNARKGKTPEGKRGRTIPNAKPKDTPVFSCIIKPGKKEIKAFMKEIKDTIKKSGNMTFEQLLRKLNPKLRGWANYYRYVVSKKIFNKVGKYILHSIVLLLKRRHPDKGIKWIQKRYFTTIDRNNWVPFAEYKTRKGRTARFTLVNISKDIPIIRFVKVKGNHSPLDPSLKEYWAKRNASNGKTRFASRSKLEHIFNREKGICPICTEHITLDDEFELHHIKPVNNGGTNHPDNLVFLHKECHKSKHKVLHYNLVDDVIDNDTTKKEAQNLKES